LWFKKWVRKHFEIAFLIKIGQHLPLWVKKCACYWVQQSLFSSNSLAILRKKAA